MTKNKSALIFNFTLVAILGIGLATVSYVGGQGVTGGASGGGVPCPTGSSCNAIGMVTGGGTAGTLQAYYDLSELTGTTLVDHSGNSNNGTLCSGGNAPTWVGVGLHFTGGQCIQLPLAPLASAQTVLLWFRNRIQPVIVNQFYYQDLLSADAAATINFITVKNNQPNLTTSINQTVLDRYQGNTSMGLVFGSPVSVYRDGRPSLGNLGAATINLSWAPATTILLGAANTAGLNGWYGDLIGFAAWSGTLSATQMAASDTAHKTFATRTRGVQWVDEVPHSFAQVVFQGSSITACVGPGNDFKKCFEYYAQLASFPFDFWPLGVSGAPISGSPVSDVAAAMSTINSPPGAVPVYMGELGTNDVHGNGVAATVYAAILSQCAAVHALGMKCAISTILPRTDNSGPQNTQLAALNALLVSNVLAGTATNVDYLSPVANDPQMGSTQGNANTNLYCDGIHPCDAGNAVLGNLYGLTLSQLVEPHKPFWIPVTVPYNTTAVGATAALSVTVNLLQLYAGQFVCGVTQYTTTGFTGGAIASVTASIGNSVGSTTSYTAAASVATGTTTLAPAYPTPALADNGIVTATFTSTVANLSALTAGSVTFDICVQKR